MDRAKAFKVGDYIGDTNDRCWLIKEETEQGFVIVDMLEGTHREITNESHPRCYWGRLLGMQHRKTWHTVYRKSV